MTQDNALFQGTVRDNLLWRNRVSDTEILALLSRLGLEKGLDTRIDNGGTEFSGGQRKCLLLTRALLEDSPIYLLDEAFAGVDERHGSLIREELERVAQPALVIAITHDQAALEDLEKTGRQVLII